MAVHRIKQNFTSGEVSPLLEMRDDFERFKNGCSTLKNMIVLTQGPATRRPGFKYVINLSDYGLDPANPLVRMEEFIFNEKQAYVLIFYMHVDGSPRVVFGTSVDGTHGLVTYPAVPTDPCPPGSAIPGGTPGEVVYLPLNPTFDIETFDCAQSGDYFYITQDNQKPTAMVRYAHDCWDLVNITFTNQPADWSDENGWPEVVTLHQQRLAVAGTLTKRQTVWTSKAGDFHDFSKDDGSGNVQDDSAIQFTLDSGTQNKIHWLQSSKALNIGTLGNEWTVVGGTMTAITPTNLLSNRQTNNGSQKIRPLMINLATLFVEFHGRKINEFTYDYTYDSYKTHDITILAPHLTEDYSITDWAYQQTPDSIVWCVREDGALLGLTYQREHKVVGWHRHETQGNFKAVASIPGTTREDDVWTIVERDNGYLIEVLDDQFKGEDTTVAHFLDAFVKYDGEATDVITGLDHLEGQEVNILADGAVHPPEVVLNGQITLNKEYSKVCVGLLYESDTWPLLPDLKLQDGSAEGRKQRITRIYINLYRSLGLEYGRYDTYDGEHSEVLPFRKPSDITGQAVPLFTGYKVIEFPEGYDDTSNYFIRQRQPLPLTILGVVDLVEAYK